MIGPRNSPGSQRDGLETPRVFANQTKYAYDFWDAKKKHANEKQRKDVCRSVTPSHTSQKSTPTWRGSFREAVFGFRARNPTDVFFSTQTALFFESGARRRRAKRGARNKLITSFCQEWFYDRVRSRTACVSRVVLFLLSHRRVPVLPAAGGGWTRRLTARAAPSPSPRFAARRRAARAGPPPPGWGAS